MSVATAPAASPRIECPRCGYDQRGAMATWRESCPLGQTCTECGLEFEWRELFDSRLGLPRWCVESRRSAWAFPGQFIGTTWRCWLSILLWRAVQMIHPLNWRRLCLWLAAWCALATLIVMLSNGLYALGQWQMYVTPFTGVRGSPGWTASTGPWPLFLQATAFPFSGKSIGTYSFPRQPPRAYTPPRTFLEAILSGFAVPMLLLIVTPITCAWTFAALPISRRRAKTRWAHVARGATYTYGIVLTVALASLLDNGLEIWLNLPSGPAAVAAGASRSLAILRLISGFASLVIGIIYIGMAPAIVCFWWSCAKRHLRMEHAFAVGMSVATIGMLAPLSIYGLLWYLLD